MSLKAKIEAVIYASEEPVTLAQLVGLLAEEAAAELANLDARQPELPLGEAAQGPQANALAEFPTEAKAEAEPEAEPEAGDPDALNAETLEEPGTPLDAASEMESQAVPEEAAAQAPLPAELPASAEIPAPAAEDDKATARARERRLREFFRSLLDELISDYANNDRGLEIREVAGGFRLATKPEYHDAVRGFVKHLKPPLKLSLQALETLAVVAYKQPVTAPEVSEIRGVDSGGVLGSLMARKLVTTAGRKQVIGRPILYKTTKDFLVRFGLKDINELPSIEEFERMAGELADAEPIQEEIPMNAAPHSMSGDRDSTPAASSAAVNEINAAPGATHIAHDTPEDLMSDKSSNPEGHLREHTDPNEVEPMAGVHAAQADGDPSDSGEPSKNAGEHNRPDEHSYHQDRNPADDEIVHGRIGGLIPPSEQRDTGTDPEVDSPALDAEVQGEAGEGR